MRRIAIAAALFLLVGAFTSTSQADLKLATFDVDASPPVGTALAYDPSIGVQNPLSCRGVVLIGSGKPIVLCAVDWIGIGTGGQVVFKESFAKAAGTTPGRVAVNGMDVCRARFKRTFPRAAAVSVEKPSVTPRVVSIRSPAWT